jgi:hypothetical protein
MSSVKILDKQDTHSVIRYLTEFYDKPVDLLIITVTDLSKLITLQDYVEHYAEEYNENVLYLFVLSEKSVFLFLRDELIHKIRKDLGIEKIDENNYQLILREAKRQGYALEIHGASFNDLMKQFMIQAASELTKLENKDKI